MGAHFHNYLRPMSFRARRQPGESLPGAKSKGTLRWLTPLMAWMAVPVLRAVPLLLAPLQPISGFRKVLPERLARSCGMTSVAGSDGITRGRDGDLGSTRPRRPTEIFPRTSYFFQTNYFSQMIWAFLSSACSLRAARARSPRGTGGGPTGPNSHNGRSPWA